MKRLLMFLFCCLGTGSLMAKDGYKLQLNFTEEIPDQMVYLAHYYAKSFPTVYKVDSGKVVNGQMAIIENKDSVLGGVYMIIFNNNSKVAELLLDNGDHFKMIIDPQNNMNNRFEGSSQNSSYMAYQSYLMDYSKEREELTEEMKKASSKADTQKVNDRADKLVEKLTSYRKDLIKKNPNSLFASLLNALVIPEAPKGTHYLEDGKTVDSNFAYTYYKNHYWDNFDFNDNRLMFSPIYDGRLNEYFNKLVYPFADSVIYESDKILEKARGSQEIFKYTLFWLARNAEKSKVMGMDEVFVHLVENYYMKGDAFWLSEDQVAKYRERAQKIAPNVLGNPAPKLVLQDIWDLNNVPLDEVIAPYTLVIFWSPTCGGCQREIPLLDSVYNNGLKQKGLKVYSIPTDGDLRDIQKFVEKEHIQDWINVVDAHNNSNYRDNYDVYSTPRIYLLDQDKKIIGKGIDHSNVMELIDWQEKKAKKSSKG